MRLEDPLKICLLCAASFVVSCVGAETFSLAPLGDAKLASVKAPPVAKDANVVKVMGRGVGTNRASALKDAYRDAVERAVGLYVDAEQMAKIDEIVSDQILTQSNAYIEKYDIIKESTANGLVTIKILALVRKQELTKRMKDVMSPQTYDFNKGDAANAHARMVTEAKRNEDAAALVENFLKDFDLIGQLMKVGLVSPNAKIMAGKSGTGTTDLAYLLKIEVDRKKYFGEFVPKLKQILDQISLTKPKAVRFVDHIQKVKWENYAKYYASYSSEYDKGRSVPFSWVRRDGCYAGIHAFAGNLYGKYSGLVSCSAGSYVYIENAGKLEMSGKLDGQEKEHPDSLGEVYLVTEVTATGFKAFLYKVDASVAKIMIDWHQKTREATKEYNIVFKDAEGNELGGLPWLFEGDAHDADSCKGVGLLMNTSFVHLDDRDDTMSMHWFVTPFINCWADQFIEWRSFTFKSEDVSKISSVSLEFVE